MLKNLHKTIQFTLVLTFTVIILGAFTRLKDAGLGCPDWPGCYGHILAPSLSATFNQIEVTKAWIEMIHRYIAGSLGLLILYITIQSIRIRTQKPNLWIFAILLSMLVVFQALLGMWTVTLKLNPLVVMGHLLGGLAILSVLWWMFLQFINVVQISTTPNLNLFIKLCLCVLIAQIALGGWTSANYAALVCADFPQCQGQYWPTMDWSNAFAIPNLPLENAARVTIQMAHRIGALVTTILLSILSISLFKTKALIYKILGSLLLILLGIQIALGITNVLAGLPLIVSLAHNAVAVLLLLCLITILYVNVKKHFSA